jgi:hypothetical protein
LIHRHCSQLIQKRTHHFLPHCSFS